MEMSRYGRTNEDQTNEASETVSVTSQRATRGENPGWVNWDRAQKDLRALAKALLKNRKQDDDTSGIMAWMVVHATHEGGPQTRSGHSILPFMISSSTGMYTFYWKPVHDRDRVFM